MNRSVLALGGAAVVVVAAVVALNFLPKQSGVGSATPLPSPTPTAVPTSAPPTSTPAGIPAGSFDIEDNGVTMTVTIPAPGWTFTSEITALQKGKEVANLPEAATLFWFYPAGTKFYVPGDPCKATSTKPANPVTTADDLAAALAAQASRTASQPVDVTVGGSSGKSLILHVPDSGVSSSCEGGEFVSYGTEKDPLARFHQGPGQIDAFWILNVNGGVLIIDSMYRPDTSAELLAEMRGIVESTTFGGQ